VEVFISPPIREYVFDRPTVRYATHDPLGIILHGDWNDDGKGDLAFSQFDYSFGSTDDLVDLILGSEMSVTLRFLFGRPYGLPSKPDQNVKLRIRNRSFHPQMFPPFSMEGDFNGDGAADLLVRRRVDRCEILLSQDRRGRLETRPAVSFAVAGKGICRIADLDGDGRSDILVADPEDRRITALLSRP
jgi:hypothetical protein